MLSRSRIPNFFIIGAAKAGTTTIHDLIKQHPDVYISKIKEPQFFCNDDQYQKGMRFYVDTYFNNCEDFCARGEATPHYLFYEKAAMRIARNIPKSNQRFIVILRNPIKRAYSLYWNMVAEGIEKMSFEEAINSEKDRIDNAYTTQHCSLRYTYVSSSKYAEQIRGYLNYFEKSQFKFIIFEEFVQDIERAVNSVFDFLGLQKSVNIDKGLKANSFGLPRFKWIHQFIRKPLFFKTQIGKIIPLGLKYRISNKIIALNKKKDSYPPMNPDMVKRLSQIFYDDIEDLEAILGKDLSIWKNAAV